MGYHSFSRTGAYERLEANETPLWRPLIGDILQRVEVLGWNLWIGKDDEVRVIKFCFSKKNVYIGVGHKAEDFRMGDDVLIRSEDDFRRWPDAKMGEILWSAGK